MVAYLSAGQLHGVYKYATYPFDVVGHFTDYMNKRPIIFKVKAARSLESDLVEISPNSAVWQITTG
jgi:hypothetical protein